MRLQRMLIGLVLTWAMMIPACRADDKESTIGSAEPNAVARRPASDPNGSILDVYSLIYRGDFAGAQKGLTGLEPNAIDKDRLEALHAVVDQYQVIEKVRVAGRQKAFLQQLDRLQELRTGKRPAKDPNDPNAPVDVHQAKDVTDANTPKDVNEPKGPVDFNDPNGRGITSVLAVVANAVEYADDRQSHDLMADPLVRRAIEKGIDRAARLESEAKWLDAYAGFGMWLKDIDPNNAGYKEYADGLMEKAVIAATFSGGYKEYAEGLLEKAMIADSFKDSPCETSQQRYEGVSQRILSRGLRIIDNRYVNKPDYGQMAIQAAKRCKQLAEVLAILPPSKTAGMKTTFTPPEPNAVKAWSSGLASLVDEVKQSAMGLNERAFRAFFEKVLQLNQSTVRVPEEVLIWHFSQAALESLDPHTMIAWPKERADFDKQITNEFTGVGVEISKSEGVLTVGSLLLDTPAYRAGLDAGDVIETVDGIPTKDMTLLCAVKKITGPKGTPVVLAIRRRGEEKTREVTIVRDRIIVPTVYGWQRTQEGRWRYLIDPNDQIGYVRLNGFTKETGSNFEKVLLDLEKEGLRGLVLDLRWNQGGQLDVALRIVDMFVRDGVILKVRPGLFGGSSEEMRAVAEGTHPDYPLVILINEVSASASEIVAGALADPRYERAVLVGERTHGKGSVQSIEDRDLDGAEVKYTTAYYYLPSDHRVYSRQEREKLGRKDWGVGPDVEMSLRIDEVRTMVEAQRANDVLAQADRPTTKEPIKRRSIQQFLEADPQLAVGLLVVKTKLIQAGQVVQ